MKNIIDNLSYLTFLGYIAFIPSGPYPIPILGIRLDVLFGLILFFLVIPKFIRIKNYYPATITISLWIYITTTFVSVIFSENQTYSLLNWLIILGYILVCFLAPTVIYSKAKNIRLFILSVAVLISLIIIYSAISFGFSQRIYLGIFNTNGAVYNQLSDVFSADNSVDPNMTAIGLLMSIVIYLPSFQVKGESKPKQIFKLVAFITIVIGAILTLSRTAILSLIISCIISFLFNIKKVVNKNIIKRFFQGITNFVLVFFLFFIVYQLVPDSIETLINRISISGEDDERITLINESVTIFMKGNKNILFGEGFFMTNPHNEFLRYLSSSGLFGIIGFLSLLTALYVSIVRKVNTNYWLTFSTTSLYFFILIAAQSYGHTKTLWISFMFVCIYYLEDKTINHKLNQQNTKNVVF